MKGDNDYNKLYEETNSLPEFSLPSQNEDSDLLSLCRFLEQYNDNQNLFDNEEQKIFNFCLNKYLFFNHLNNENDSMQQPQPLMVNTSPFVTVGNIEGLPITSKIDFSNLDNPPVTPPVTPVTLLSDYSKYSNQNTNQLPLLPNDENYSSTCLLSKGSILSKDTSSLYQSNGSNQNTDSLAQLWLSLHNESCVGNPTPVLSNNQDNTSVSDPNVLCNFSNKLNLDCNEVNNLYPHPLMNNTPTSIPNGTFDPLQYLNENVNNMNEICDVINQMKASNNELYNLPQQLNGGTNMKNVLPSPSENIDTLNSLLNTGCNNVVNSPITPVSQLSESLSPEGDFNIDPASIFESFFNQFIKDSSVDGNFNVNQTSVFASPLNQSVEDSSGNSNVNLAGVYASPPNQFIVDSSLHSNPFNSPESSLSEYFKNTPPYYSNMGNMSSPSLQNLNGFNYDILNSLPSSNDTIVPENKQSSDQLDKVIDELI